MWHREGGMKELNGKHPVTEAARENVWRGQPCKRWMSIRKSHPCQMTVERASVLQERAHLEHASQGFLQLLDQAAPSKPPPCGLIVIRVAETFALEFSGETCPRFQDYRLKSELEWTILC